VLGVDSEKMMEGQEFHGHQDDTPKQTGSGSEGVMNECADSGQTLVIEMPDHRLIAMQPLDPNDRDDDLVSELLESNAAFQALVAKSKASPRKAFGES
jgi:hypothetical protein